MPDEFEVAPAVGGSTPRNGAPPERDRNLRRRVRRWWRHHSSGAIAAIIAVVLIAGTLTAIFATRHLGDVDPPPLPAAVSAVSSPAAVPPRATPAVLPVSTAKGTVVAVINPGRWTFAVEQGLQVTVIAPPTTVYSSGHTAADVKKGSMLTVTGTFVSGVITAKSVTFDKKKKKSA